MSLSKVGVRFWLLSQRPVVLLPLLVAAAVASVLAGGATAADPGPDMVEIVEARTANSKTFRRSDGTTTKRLFAGNVHFREDGTWKTIDPRLVPAAPAEQGKGFGWRVKSHGFNVLSKRKLEAGYLRTDVQGRQLSFSLRGARPAPATVRGAEVVYPEALPGVDLRYAVHPEGVKEQLLLKSRQSPSSFTFLLEPPADTELVADELASGDWAFRLRGGGRPLFILTAPYATDEPLERSRPDAATRHQARDRADHARMDVARVQGGFEITLAVDAAWLNADDRKFPVTLDPTLVLQPTTKSAEFDASCGACEGWDYWALYIGSDDVGGLYRSGFQFDLSSIPPSANVTDAKLGLYNPSDSCVWTTKPCGADSHVLNVHEMTRAWTPDVTTWSQVGWNTTAVASYTLAHGAGDNWMTWNLTPTTKAWIAGTKANHGVLVKRATEPSDAGGPEVPGGAWDGDPTLRPRLDVTYTSDAPRFHEPETLYGNGADLRWDRFDGSSGNAFAAYEIHRGAGAGFTPSDATRIASIRDVNVTSFRDTTAAPGKTFTYKIVVNGSASAPRTVTLPADGQARKVLQPDSERGKSTYVDNADGPSTCTNYGAETYMYVGNDTWAERALVGFDLRDIPAGATITSATLSAYMWEPPAAALTVSAHRVTAGWDEGTGLWDCTGDGASWTHRSSGTRWATPGGDYVATAAATKAHTATDAPGWDDFDVSSIARAWTDGTAPNHGILLRTTNESPGTYKGGWVTYHSDDYLSQPTLRPKLAVSYTDPGAKAVAPTVAIASPQAGDSVRDTVTIEASASDDRRVDKVEILVDGAVKATDTAAPYSYAWDTKTATNAAHTLTARATDDAGNVTTSAATAVTVANSALPTTRVTSPSAKYDDVVKADSPAVFWRLGEAAGATTAADASGNGRTGAYAGDRTAGQLALVAAESDKAITLLNQTTTSTTDGRVSAALAGLLGSQLTAEAWISYGALASNGTENRVWSRNWGAAGGWRLSVARNAAGQQVAEFAINKAGAVTTTSAVVTPGKLHLAGTYDGATLRLYVNGAQASSTPLAAAPLDTTASVFLGQTLTGNTVFDEAALYARAVSAQQLQAHYETGAARPLTVKGQRSVQAAAADDGSVSKVEFYVDGNRFGEDTTAPYSATLDTKSAAEPVYDGTRQLTTRAYDNHGQVTTSTTVDIAVRNTDATPYAATFASTAAPQAVVYDPAAATQDRHGMDVTVTNRSAQPWSATDHVVRPRWITPDGSTIAGSEVALGAALAPNASAQVRVFVEAPALPDGVDKAQYRLQVDVFEKSTQRFFADQGNAPLENPVIVNKALRTGLGLEKYYHYDGENLGAGMQHLANVANGNSLLRWTPFESPGRGVSTVLDITYNSLEKKSESPIGNNFSLAISSLSRFGNPIDIHPNKADEIAGRANRFVEVTDGDGTTHRFTGRQAPDGAVYWEEPDGVHLYLRSLATTDPRGRWALTRPDRITFFYDVDGYPTMVEDANGNRLTFTLEATPPGEDPGGPKKRITAVTDAAGQGASPAPNRSFKLTYYSKAEAKKAHIRGKVKRITDHSGSALDFVYYEDGNLLKIVQRGGTNADGTPLADRSFVFTYTTSNGDAPAIPAPADRVNPEPKTPNQSTRLFSVRDPRGKETTFTYLGTGNGQDRWKLASRTNRGNETSTYGYDSVARVTTVVAPKARTTKFAYDVEGKVTSITDPIGEQTRVEWTGDRHVFRVFEPSNRYTQFDYDNNGYLTRARDQRGKVTTLEYDHPAVDGNDVAGKWKTGRNHEHISQLRRKVDPNGNELGADPNNHDWLFQYDARGNLRFLTDPDNKTSERWPNPDGTVAWAKDPRGNQTSFVYDANGLPSKVTDAENQITQFGHDDDGLLRYIQDANHAGHTEADVESYRTYLYYDAFHRMGRQSAPIWTAGPERGNLIWSGARFDENDNLVMEIGAHEGREFTGTGAKTTHDYDAMDRRTLTTGPDREVDPAGERSRIEYDEAGRPWRFTEPKGVATGSIADDFTTVLEYDALDRVIRKIEHNVEGGAIKETKRTHYCYEALTGDIKWIVSPRAQAADGVCSATTVPRFTEQFTYDEAHQILNKTDAGHGAAGVEKHTVKRTYDANGNVRTTTDERGTVTETRYNGRDLPIEQIDFLDKARNRKLTSRLDYDDAGNLTKVISPRAVDVAGTATPTEFVETTMYDKVNRPIRTDLPRSGTEAQLYVHRRYDGNSNLTATSLPVTLADGGDSTLHLVDARDKTTYTHFDTGWLKTENQPGTPRVRFAYTPEGWQRSRVPETESGVERWDRQTTWQYWVDGMLRQKRERDGGAITYAYDANNQLTKAHDASGVDDSSADPFDVTVSYDGFGRQTEVREQKLNSTRAKLTQFTEYDLEDNLVERIDNRDVSPTGSVLEPGRRHRYTYDDGGWLVEQLDFGRKDGADTDAHVDDRRITTDYFETGWEKQRTIAKRPAGSAATAGFTAVKQRTSWDYLDNGKLKALRTRNGSDELLESHDVSYEDAAGRYVNGHRTKDVFTLRGPKAEADCRDAANPCTTHYTYDARDRLTEERRIRGGSEKKTTYTLLPTGDIDIETRHGGIKIDNDYVGQQIRTRTLTVGTAAPLIQRYNHNLDGDLECVFQAATAAETRTCANAESSGKLLEKYEYDPLDRVRKVLRFKPNGGGKDDETTYRYDALDRVVEQDEKHGAGGSDEDRITRFQYLGTSNDSVEELLTYTSGPKTGKTRTKTFSYDAFGDRIAMTDRSEGQADEKEFTYGNDVHGNVSLLIDETGQAKAQYGYTPYGGIDEELTKELDPVKEADPTVTDKAAKPEDPVNPYRFSQKRFDSGSETLDMGVRRFGPDAGRFLQQDFFEEALGNLGLATDPLSQNRYALAGSNPISFVEVDGHMLRLDGGGGAVRAPSSSSGGGGGGGSSSGGSGGSSGGGTTRNFVNVFRSNPFSTGNIHWEIAQRNARMAELREQYMNQPADDQGTLSKLLMGTVDREGDPYCGGPPGTECEEAGMGSLAKVVAKPLLRAAGQGAKLPGARQLLAQASRFASRSVRPNYKPFTERHFRANLMLRTGKTPPSTVHAHHTFPKGGALGRFFRSRGIEPNNPQYGTWWQGQQHIGSAQAYNREWQLWIARNRAATRDEVIEQGRRIMQQFGQRAPF